MKSLSLNEVKVFLEKHKAETEVMLGAFGLYGAVTFAIGYIIWTIYIEAMGFSITQIFQPVFIYSGIVFSTLCIIASKYINLSKVRYRSVILLSFFILGIYSLVIFPFIPRELGGGAPRVMSLIGSTEQIQYLGKFAIPIASEVQTAQLCVLYEDQDNIILILTDRVISVKKEDFKGYVSLPSVQILVQKIECSLLTISYTIPVRVTR